jgi:hypothetical protein
MLPSQESTNCDSLLVFFQPSHHANVRELVRGREAYIIANDRERSSPAISLWRVRYARLGGGTKEENQASPRLSTLVEANEWRVESKRWKGQTPGRQNGE